MPKEGAGVEYKSQANEGFILILITSGDRRQRCQKINQKLRKIMHLTMEFRSLVLIFLVVLQLVASSPLPSRNKRHVDGMFTSEFSRARGSAAIRKYINSALAGKRDTENIFQPDAMMNVGPEATSQKKALPGYNALPELRSENKEMNGQDVTDSQVCSAILYLLKTAPYQSTHITQDY